MKVAVYPTKKRFLVFVLLLSALPFFAQKGNKGKVVEQERTVSSFKAIDAATGIDVYLSQGNKEKVVVKADAIHQDKVKVSVNGGVLELRISGEIKKANALDVYVTVVNLNKIQATSGSDVQSTGKLSLEKLEVVMKSGSDLSLELDAKSLVCTLTSGSDAMLKGSVGKLDVSAMGGSDIMAKNLKAGDCKLRLKGGSDAIVHVNGDLDMEASGSSDIIYSGNASVVHSRATGGSDINGN